MKRGRKRKNVTTEEKEVISQSSALLPARQRSEVSQQILPVIVPIIKKEDPQIKKTKTSIPLNTDAVDTDIGESFKLQNVKSEPIFPVACAADLTSENPNYVEQNGGYLDQFEIKREPRSRSSSTETVLNEESLQLPQDECHRSSSAETLFNEESLQLPMDECQSDTSFQISSIYHVTNVDHIHSSARTNSDLSPRKESHPSFIAPVHSPNISVSQHANSELQMLSDNIPSVIKLFKYDTFNKEIAIADARESLNFLNSSYPSNGSFNLFFSNDTYLGQQEISAVEPIPTLTTAELKKIIAITSSIPTKNNSENDNIIKDTNVNAPSDTVSTSQLPISIKQEKESDHIFNPNIRIKDEPIDDYDSTSVNHRLLTCNKRSAEETSTKMQGFFKKRKISSELPLSATCIDSQIKPGDSTGNSIDTSKGRIQSQCLENAPITSNTLKCFTLPNSSSSNTVSDNALQNNATMSHVFSVSRTENSKVTDSIVSNPTSSVLTSYLHLLPNDIKDKPCTDEAADSNQRAIVSVKSSTSVSNFAVVTTASDAVVIKNYNQNPTSIDSVSTCSARQHVEETNLEKERNPSDNNILVASNKINMLNFSQPDIIPSDSVTTKKKISAKMYFQRKSSSHFLDPCTQKNIGQNSVPQVSSPHSTLTSQTKTLEEVNLALASLMKQTNQNRTPTAYTQNNAHQYQKTTSAPRFEIASSVQQNSLQNSLPSQGIMPMATPTETAQRSVTSFRKQTQEDSNISHKSSRRSEEFSSSTSRDPRKTYSNSYYQKVFGSSRQYLSLLRDIAYNKFIETKDLPYIILNWDVNWLSKQKEESMCPPIWENYLKVKDRYHNLQQYYDTYQRLLLLNIWFDIYQGWEKLKVTHHGTLHQIKREDKFVKMSCTFITSAADRSNRLMKEDIVILTSTSAGKTQMFGRIVDMVEEDWENSSKPYQFVKPGVYKQLILEIMCAEKFDVQIPSLLQLQNVTNIGVALKQNDALRCINPAMQAIILNPSQNEQLLQTTTVPPINNICCMLHSIRTLDKRVTIINTSSPSYSVTATLQVAYLLKTNSILLVALKDKKSFLNLAFQMKNLAFVLAIRENEVPPELRTRTVNYCDSATLMSRQVILAHIPSMFFGKIESRLKTESTVCIIHEAQYFFEPETASLLAYKIEHLILTGRPDVRASTAPMLARYAFDISLFHRISKKS